MIRRSFLTFLVLVTVPLHSKGQIQYRSESWWGLMTSGQIADRWSLWIDSHYVPELFIIVRSGLTYHTPSEKLNFTAGYANLGLTTPYSQGKLIRPEKRPWVQMIYRFPSKRPYNVSFRFRYDGRFRNQFDNNSLLDAYDFNHRFRFNSAIRYNIGQSVRLQSTFSLSMVNETLLTTGPSFVDIPFEHRIFMLTGIQRGASTISPGYHFRFQSTSSEQVRVLHGFVLWINLNYRFKDFKRHFLREFPADKI
ncbi:DUF2490 domain-containing protein [Cecembia rubra]|uniref:Uncharacterized protein DUF2490 n=1 Tax=Cecembia rubra TaxID=1485585 RepID=A0A2P8EDS3_9BACT|nr:DUF2490 domain-containing protein [Cecembia rubra]PSL07584.1 uncharacterized protein DUF2490 [Cecembia rubra]